MVIIREHGHISPHVVHDHRETLKHGIYGLTREDRLQRAEPEPSVPGMSILQLLPNPARQILCPNPFEFGFTQRTVQVVDHLVVGVEHVSRSWSKEVQRMNISCVHCDIPLDLTLAAEESSHPPFPHMVVLTIKVWRIRTPFLVRHLWILDWLESRRSITDSDTN
jgi:hypothetical protein